MGGQIGIYEKSQKIEILRENSLIQRESKRTKRGVNVARLRLEYIFNRNYRVLK